MAMTPPTLTMTKDEILEWLEMLASTIKGDPRSQTDAGRKGRRYLVQDILDHHGEDMMTLDDKDICEEALRMIERGEGGSEFTLAYATKGVNNETIDETIPDTMSLNSHDGNGLGADTSAAGSF